MNRTVGPTPLLVAVIIGLRARRADWPRIALDTEAVADRAELPVAVVESVVAGLTVLGFLTATGERDRRGRCLYRARLPA